MPAGQGEPPVLYASNEHASGVGFRFAGLRFTIVATSKALGNVAPHHGHSDPWRSHGAIIEAQARTIVGWRVGTSPYVGFVLDSLEQALHERRPVKGMGASCRATVAASIRRSNTLKDWQTRASNLRLAAPAAVRTAHWSRRSTIPGLTQPH